MYAPCCFLPSALKSESTYLRAAQRSSTKGCNEHRPLSLRNIIEFNAICKCCKEPPKMVELCNQGWIPYYKPLAHNATVNYKFCRPFLRGAHAHDRPRWRISDNTLCSRINFAKISYNDWRGVAQCNGCNAHLINFEQRAILVSASTTFRRLIERKLERRVRTSRALFSPRPKYREKKYKNRGTYRPISSDGDSANEEGRLSDDNGHIRRSFQVEIGLWPAEIRWVIFVLGGSANVAAGRQVILMMMETFRQRLGPSTAAAAAASCKSKLSSLYYVIECYWNMQSIRTHTRHSAALRDS